MDAVSGATSVSTQQSVAVSAPEQRQNSTLSLAEMVKDAKEKAEARRDQFKLSKNSQRYGDAPIEAYTRLARARNQAGVSAAISFARRKIAQFQAAKSTDSENAQQIQAAIRQLRKAVTRAGRKQKDLIREQAAEKRRVKLEKEERLRESRRLRQELRRVQSLRAARESGYVREAEMDARMQSYLVHTRMEVEMRNQSLSVQVTPSMEAAVQQYAAAAAPAEVSGGEISVEA